MSADLRPNPNDTPEQAAAKLAMRQAVQDHIVAQEAKQSEKEALAELIRDIVRQELRLGLNENRLREEKRRRELESTKSCLSLFGLQRVSSSRG